MHSFLCHCSINEWLENENNMGGGGNGGGGGGAYFCLKPRITLKLGGFKS